ncbi:hypothetical protein BS639_16945, partial [Rouxiella silvae]
ILYNHSRYHHYLLFITFIIPCIWKQQPAFWPVFFCHLCGNFATSQSHYLRIFSLMHKISSLIIYFTPRIKIIILFI